MQYPNQYRQPYHTQWAGPPITPQPPPIKKAQNGQKALLAFLLAALLLSMPLLGYLYAPQIISALISIEPSCTVGITGTAATITFQGWQAAHNCTTLISGNQSLQITLAKVYLLDSPPNEPIVCQVDKDGLRITVRDEGILKLVGNTLCQTFLSPTQQPSS